MSEAIILNFTIGFFIGGMLGVMGMAILTSGKTEDLYREIQDLRTQRKLLKEELVKNKFINNQMKNGSVAIFEGGGSEHPRIRISEWEQYLPEFKVELIGVSPEQRYSVCKATYVG